MSRTFSFNLLVQSMNARVLHEPLLQAGGAAALGGRDQDHPVVPRHTPSWTKWNRLRLGGSAPTVAEEQQRHGGVEPPGHLHMEAVTT